MTCSDSSIRNSPATYSPGGACLPLGCQRGYNPNMADPQKIAKLRRIAALIRKRWTVCAVAATVCLLVFSYGPEATVAGLGIALTAFYIWLGVRIVNRRERWAKWTAAGLTLAFAAYPFSWGLWLRCMPDEVIREQSPVVFAWGFYAPIVIVLNSTPDEMRQPYMDYLQWMVPKAFE